jgi:hypothetical protein
MSVEIHNTYGPQAELADWDDLKSILLDENEINIFLQDVRINIQHSRYDCDNIIIQRGGHESSQGLHYLMARHDGIVPPNWLVLDGLGHNDIHLGKWNYPGYALLRVPSNSTLATRADAASSTEGYTLEGIALGDDATRSKIFPSLSCSLSEMFESAYWCTRSQQQQGRNRAFTDTVAVLYSNTGATSYVAHLVEPAYFAPNDIEGELARLSHIYRQRPKVLTMPMRDGMPGGVIASWGDVTLERLSFEEIRGLANGINPKRGFLVDFLGNFKRSAQANLPIFAIHGGAGLIWNASFDESGKGNLRISSIDASKLRFVGEASLSTQPTWPRSNETSGPDMSLSTGEQTESAVTSHSPPLSRDRYGSIAALNSDLAAQPSAPSVTAASHSTDSANASFSFLPYALVILFILLVMTLWWIASPIISRLRMTRTNNNLNPSPPEELLISNPVDNAFIQNYKIARGLRHEALIHIDQCLLDFSDIVSSATLKVTYNERYLDKTNFQAALRNYDLAFQQYQIANVQNEAAKNQNAAARAKAWTDSVNSGSPPAVIPLFFGTALVAPRKPRENDFVSSYSKSIYVSVTLQKTGLSKCRVARESLKELILPKRDALSMLFSNVRESTADETEHEFPEFSIATDAWTTSELAKLAATKAKQQVGSNFYDPAVTPGHTISVVVSEYWHKIYIVKETKYHRLPILGSFGSRTLILSAITPRINVV